MPIAIRCISALLLGFLSLSASADQVRLTFTGFVETGDPFTAVVEYSTDAADANGPGCCAKYVPMAISFTVEGETTSLPNGALNVDVVPGENFEGIQWVDDGEPWSGTLFGQSVETLSINFGRNFTGTMTKDLPTSVDLSEWDYTNGTFVLDGAGSETYFEILEAESELFSVCSSSAITVADLSAELDTMDTGRHGNKLAQELAQAQAALDSGDNDAARSRLGKFVSKTVHDNNVSVEDANQLACGAANVLNNI